MRVSKTLPLTIGTQSGNRPQPLSVNKSSPQYSGSGYQLLAWWPLWITSSTANAVDLASGLIAKPTNVKVYNDQVMGPVFQGDGAARNYKVTPFSSLLDFGWNQHSRPPKAFSISAWVQSSTPGSSYNSPNGPPNAYILTTDYPADGYPGYGISLTQMNGQWGIPSSPGNNGASIGLDMNRIATNSWVFGAKPVNDGNWHLVVGVWNTPGTVVNGNTTTLDVYVDGALDTQLTPHGVTFGGGGGVDSCDVESPYDAGAPVCYIGTDDDGSSSPFRGNFTDLRVYSGALPASVVSAMYAAATRYDLYN